MRIQGIITIGKKQYTFDFPNQNFFTANQNLNMLFEDINLIEEKEKEERLIKKQLEEQQFKDIIGSIKG